MKAEQLSEIRGRLDAPAPEDVRLLLAEIDSLQQKLDRSENRSRTWRELYNGKRRQTRALIDAIHEITDAIHRRFGISAEGMDATYRNLIQHAESEDDVVEAMEAIEDFVTDPVWKDGL